MGLLDIFKMDNNWKGKTFVRDRDPGGGPRRRPKIDTLLGGRYNVIRTPGGREVPHQEARGRYKNRNQARSGGPPPPLGFPDFPPRQGDFGGPRNVYDPLPPRRDPPPQNRDPPDQQDEEAGGGEDEAEDENEPEVANRADRSHRNSGGSQRTAASNRMAASNATTGRHGRRMGGGDQGPAPRPCFATPGYWDPPRGGGGPPHMRDPLGGAPQAHWGPTPPYGASGMGGRPDYMEPLIGLPMGGGRKTRWRRKNKRAPVLSSLMMREQLDEDGLEERMLERI